MHLHYGYNCSDTLVQTYCYGGETLSSGTWRQSGNPTKGTHAVNEPWRCLSRASRGDGEGDGRVTTDSGARRVGGWGLDWRRLSRNRVRQEIKTNDESRHTARELQQRGKHTELLFYKHSERNQAWATAKLSKNFKYQLISQRCKL